MKRVFCTLAVLALTPMFGSTDAVRGQDLPAPGEGQQLDAKTATDWASYGIGRNIGGSLQRDGIDVNMDQLIQGLKDAMAGSESKYSDEQLQAAFEAFSQVMEAKQQQRGAVLAEKNKREGSAFLAANRSKPGVRTLENGLQYMVIKKGSGPSPKATDTVSTHYHGMLTDGTVFDSSIERGQPATFPVNGVIAGWTQALQMMQVGDKWRLFIPPDLAYGTRGAGEDIGPNAVLIFDIELLGIQ